MSKSKSKKSQGEFSSKKEKATEQDKYAARELGVPTRVYMKNKANFTRS